MSRARYTHEVKDVSGKTCIIITDANQGQMSVTNDIENVVKEICDKEDLEAGKCIIVYKDSDSTWDGWDADNNHFIGLGAGHWAHAINKYLKMLRTASESSKVKTS